MGIVEKLLLQLHSEVLKNVIRKMMKLNGKTGYRSIYPLTQKWSFEW